MKAAEQAGLLSKAIDAIHAGDVETATELARAAAPTPFLQFAACWGLSLRYLSLKGWAEGRARVLCIASLEPGDVSPSLAAFVAAIGNGDREAVLLLWSRLDVATRSGMVVQLFHEVAAAEAARR